MDREGDARKPRSTRSIDDLLLTRQDKLFIQVRTLEMRKKELFEEAVALANEIDEKRKMLSDLNQEINKKGDNNGR